MTEEHKRILLAALEEMPADYFDACLIFARTSKSAGRLTLDYNCYGFGDPHTVSELAMALHYGSRCLVPSNSKTVN